VDTEMPESQRHEIGSSDLGRGVLYGVLLIVLAGGLLWVFRTPSLAVLYAGGAAVWVLLVVVRHRSDRLVLDDAGITVVTRRGGTSHAWADLLETGWSGAPWSPGCRVLVRRRGGAFAVPGPNAPGPVATLAIFRRRKRKEARDALRQLSTSHGVPFSDRGALMLTDGPPDSPYR
jgi:hypothetical protein